MKRAEDRRSPATAQLRAGALRCEDCGTTWFDAIAQYHAADCRCRRCGGRMHGERRVPAVATRAA